MNTTNDTDTQFRCGYIAIVGEPNVGKSTFLNAALNVRLSITSAKPQTTRRQVLGLLTTDRQQIVFVDTPGLIKPRYALQEAMMKSAQAALADADGIVYLIDGRKSLMRETVIPTALAEMLLASRKPVLALVNKEDLCDDAGMRKTMENVAVALPAAVVLRMSALLKQGVNAALEQIATMLPAAPALFPEDALSDLPQRFFIAEIIREKIFEQFRDEIPYAAEVAVVEYTEEDAIDRISAEIIVERTSQRKIVIGAGGRGIKAIGTAARKDIEEFLEKKVFLDLHVKIRKDWRSDRNWVQRFGYQL